jgi:hypothetical protein
MGGAIPPLPQYTKMVWFSVKNTGTTLALPLNINISEARN